ncbi:MAG: nucleotidyltransferase domain-containing protein [Candidatus Omnitrophica bacterium]|nr:nucleotidyltransferase domain-containing protein [Candidatus Omnitrophota bacterium]MCM8829604.1 nucleotidyltransferase domain-containing protein [Candidatus Omnitrophota bacterium]
MGKRYVQILKERVDKKQEYFKNYLFYCEKIKNISDEILKKVEVLVFGSVVKNEHTPLSDIDVLIISENLPEGYEDRIKIKTEIKSKVGSFAPFQIHLANPQEYNNWYKRFIKDVFIKI